MIDESLLLQSRTIALLIGYFSDLFYLDFFYTWNTLWILICREGLASGGLHFCEHDLTH